MIRAILLTAFALAPLALAQQNCDANTTCGAAAPCCSEYGFCGSGSGFCYGGCNPQYSNSWNSCSPMPVCQDATYTFHNDSRIVNATAYKGDASSYDFTLDSGDVYNLGTDAGEIALLLTETNGGTRLSTTRYMWYGSVTAKLKTSKWAGVVSAFITMSDVKDEIDWEWPGANTTAAQSNYFWLGKVSYPSTNGQTEAVSSDTYANYHTYTINWQPDQLDFSIDGNFVRTVKKSDTMDSNGVANYPTTPARIQLSIWPAGINSSAPGTIEWAGGLINWSDPDYTAAGNHFADVFESVTVSCSTPANSSFPGGGRSFIYSGLDSQGVPSAYLSNASTLAGASSPRVAVPSASLRVFSGLAAVGVALGLVVLA